MHTFPFTDAYSSVDLPLRAARCDLPTREQAVLRPCEFGREDVDVPQGAPPSATGVHDPLLERVMHAGTCEEGEGVLTNLQGVGFGDVAEPAGARLRGALEGRAIDGDESESGAVAEGPLEIVEEAPVRVPAHVDAVGDRPLHALERLADVVDALVVVIRPDAVLRHQKRDLA